MGIRFGIARAVAATTTWGLRHVARRPAGNLPGKLALRIDPNVIAHLRSKIEECSIAVVGTNGKTTVTNLLADVFEHTGKRVVCNRSGANMSPGVATALLHAQPAEIGVFESDELWLARTAPQLRPRYVLLLNLFRDQLDRMGEIDRIQDSIVGALASSPETTLIFNADDPLCAAIAGRVGNPTIAFGVEGDMGLAQNTVADAQMCQNCLSMMDYSYRQYGQLGEYRCPSCGFARPERAWSAVDASFGADGMRFGVEDNQTKRSFTIKAPFGGAYMVYNLLAVAVAARVMGATEQDIQQAVDAFNPQNGRLQQFDLQGRTVLLNLAKNPTGFNQNLKIILQDKGPKTVAFFINDKVADGRDVSWLWDIDFEELAGQADLRAFAGGIRANDMQVRLKYSGVPSEIATSVEDVLQKSSTDERGGHVYIIANYTALPSLRAELTRMEKSQSVAAASAASGESVAAAPDEQTAVKAAADAPDGRAPAASPDEQAADRTAADASDEQASSAPEAQAPVSPTQDVEGEPVVICHLFPDLLNLYGDGGNVSVLAYRLRQRGIPVEVRRVKHGQPCKLDDADIVFLGGGPDREQHLASQALLQMRDDFQRFVEADGVLLAICGGFQILGREWLLGEDIVKGLGVVDMTTVRAEGGSGNRLIDNIILQSSVAAQPVVGYENHAGRTHLGSGVQPFGAVVSPCGHGNNDTSKADGVLYRNVLGTYLHGPLLSKNPQVADWLLERGLQRRFLRTGVPAVELAPLDDTEENAANEALCQRFKTK